MPENFQNFIAGEWKHPKSARAFDNRNPADTQDLVGTFADSGPEDVEQAIAAAREAFPAWKALPAPRRGEILYRAAELLVKRKEQLARDMTREMGKVLEETRGGRSSPRYLASDEWRMARGVAYCALQGPAMKLGLRGYAKNLADGRVEVLAAGDAAALDALAAWLREGPPMAHVEDLERLPARDDEAGEEFLTA